MKSDQIREDPSRDLECAGPAEQPGASRKLLSALFQISELTHSASDMHVFYGELHRIVGTLMYAQNFYIAHLRPGSDRIEFAYFRDSVDTDLTIEKINQQPQEELRTSITYQVIVSGEVIHVSPRSRKGGGEQIHWYGTDSIDWLGIPLTQDGKAFGALVVQSYDTTILFGDDDVRVLEFVCQNIATALLRRWSKEDLKQAHDDLERRVLQRTSELSHANDELAREMATRERGERLQQALYRIARLASEPMDLESFYRSIHDAILELLDARNLSIALADARAGMLRFPYVADEAGAEGDDILARIKTTGLPIPQSLDDTCSPTQRVYLTREPFLFLNDADETPQGAVGATPVAWLGVPLMAHGTMLGVLAVQSHDVATRYDQAHADLLTFVARQVANTIDRREDKAALQSAMENLEQRVLDRTAELRETNRELRAALESLESTRSQLVEAEKMASLGGLVAGISHEINTPIGVAVTAASFLQEKARQFAARDDLDEGAARFSAATGKAADLLLNNLTRASELVRSFKQVAADQSTKDRRTFNVRQYLNEILTSLRPQIRKAGHDVVVECPASLDIDSYPFAFYQVLSNMVMNSLIHGFPGGMSGEMRIEASAGESTWTLRYQDNGVGMKREVAQRVFEPFFTTRRGSGGTGLGMNIAYNHITSLGGRITCSSVENDGVCFTMEFPYVAPAGQAAASP